MKNLTRYNSISYKVVKNFWSSVFRLEFLLLVCLILFLPLTLFSSYRCCLITLFKSKKKLLSRVEKSINIRNIFAKRMLVVRLVDRWYILLYTPYYSVRCQIHLPVSEKIHCNKGSSIHIKSTHDKKWLVKGYVDTDLL